MSKSSSEGFAGGAGGWSSMEPRLMDWRGQLAGQGQPTPFTVSLRGGRRVHDPAAWGAEIRDSYPQTGNEELLQGGG